MKSRDTTMCVSENPIIFLDGQNIDLCPVRMLDLQKYIEWFNDRELNELLLMHRPYTVEQEKTTLERIVNTPIAEGLYLGIWLKDPRKLIGNCSLHAMDRQNQSAEFGIAIGDKDYWSKGYGREVTKMMVDYGFRTLNLNRIQLYVWQDNERAIKCYESCGFVKEGVLRQKRWIAGRWKNEVVMSVLRSEYDDYA